MELVHFIPSTQRRIAMLAAQADSAPVLICGSSGTGKSYIARWIHEHGARKGQPFLNAVREHPLADQIREAHGGSLMIPEIGEWPLSEQRILLQYLLHRSVPHPNDSATPMLVNVRIIATSSQRLEGRAQGGLFNAELFNKINVFRIDMPDLHQRPEEFEEIVHGITKEICQEIHKEHIQTITQPALNALKGYHWPGNIRELRNVLRVAVISAKSDRIDVGHLPRDFDQERIDFRATREEFEKIYILELLKTFDWQIDKTCQVSRINKQLLLSKMKKYGIEEVKPSTLS